MNRPFRKSSFCTPVLQVPEILLTFHSIAFQASCIDHTNNIKEFSWLLSRCQIKILILTLQKYPYHPCKCYYTMCCLLTLILRFVIFRPPMLCTGHYLSHIDLSKSEFINMTTCRYTYLFKCKLETELCNLKKATKFSCIIIKKSQWKGEEKKGEASSCANIFFSAKFHLAAYI